MKEQNFSNFNDKISEEKIKLDKLPFNIAGNYRDSNFLKKIRNGSSEIHQIKFKNTMLYMRLLTIREKREAEMGALEKWNGLPELQRLPIMNFQLEVNELLSRALNVKSFDLTIQQRISEEELNTLIESEFIDLYRQYEDLEAKFNPSLDEISEQRFTEILDDLEKKKVHLNNVSRSELAAVCNHLILERTELMDKLLTLSSASVSTNG